MKNRYMKILVVFIAFAFLFTLTSPAFAEDRQDGNSVDIEVTTDKNQYDKGDEITYSIKLLNQSPFTAKDINIKTEIPHGLEILETDGEMEGQSIIWKVDSISGLGEANVSISAKLADSETEPPVVNPGVGDGDGTSKPPGEGTMNPPQTGDDTNILFYVILLIFSVTIMTIAIIIFKRTKYAKAITFLLIMGLVATASVLTVANAEEKTDSNQVKHQFTIAGKDYETVFSIESVTFDLPTLSLGLNLPENFDEKEFFSPEEPTITDLHLSWKEIMEADSYTVQKRTLDGSYHILIEGLTDTNYVDTAITQGETYQYQIEAIYKDKVIVISNEISQLAAPELTAELENDKLQLSWSETAGADAYSVYRGVIELRDDVEVEDYQDLIIYGDYQLVKTIEETSLEVDVESNGELHYYFIKAVSGDNISLSSNVMILDQSIVDRDGDGLTDLEEIEIGSNPTNPDTNGNGIPDGYEYTVLESDPSDLESNVAEMDFDEDGLNNLEEYQNGTNPWKDDSDEDGWNDYEEINTHGTDPLSSDTDGDLLIDSREAALGFDPLKADTNGNGVIDSEEPVLQDVVVDNAEIISEDNTAVPSISIFGKGDINESVVIMDESENPLLSDLIYIEGKPIDVTLENEFEYANLSFHLEEGLNLDEYAITHFDDNGMIHLLETEIDSESHTISTTVDHFSIYFVTHLPTLYHSWGVTGSEKEDLTSPIVERGAADISFVIDSTGSMSWTISNVRDNIINFVDQLNTSDVDVRLGLVDYKDIYEDGMDSTRNHGWFTEPTKFQDVVRNLSVTGGGDTPETSADALEEARRMGFRDNVNKYMILITDADNKDGTRFDGVDTMDDVIENLVKDGITVIVISESYLETHYSNLFTSTNGIFININSNFADILANVVDLVSEEVSDGVWIRLSNGTTVKLAQEPDPADMTTDTDGDGLPDSQELVFPPKEIDIIYVDGEPLLVGVFDYNSYPNKVDSDNDGYGDKDDLEPLAFYRIPILLVHGLNDNSYNLFGIETSISSKQKPTENRHFLIENVRAYNDIDRSQSEAMNGDNYYFTGSHTIKDAHRSMISGKKNLGYELKQDGYKLNKNLFAINYPARDFNWKNADILKWYIEEYLKENKDLYPTEMAYQNRDLKLNLVGHSNGGLVSRFYIENLNGSKYVNKLITLNTPHWGSGLASVQIGKPSIGDGALENGPLHLDLEPNGIFYGGKRISMFFFDKDKQRYFNNYQSEELNYDNHGATKYYFIGAYDDLAPNLLSEDLRDRTFLFDVTPASSSFSDFRDSIADGFFARYPEYQSRVVFTFTDIGGDNVVNNQSQLGVTYQDFGNGKNIEADAYTMIIDTVKGHTLWNSLHNDTPKNPDAINQVKAYLRK